jgi:hypothetical protein
MSKGWRSVGAGIMVVLLKGHLAFIIENLVLFLSRGEDFIPQLNTPPYQRVPPGVKN